MSGVSINLANGGLGGTLQTADGIAGLVLTGGVDAGGYVLGTPKLVTGLSSLTAAGITEDDNAFAMRQIKDFYALAGDGAQLYLMLVPDTMTVADIADITEPNGAQKLLQYADGKIKLLGIMTDDTAVDTPTQEDALNSDIPQALVNMGFLANEWFVGHKPFRAIIGGTSYSGVPADLADQTADSMNRVAILIGDTRPAPTGGIGGAACLGMALGLAASLPVQRKLSRVQNGRLPTVSAYVGQYAVGAVGSDEGVIAGRGYITFRRYPNVTGFFFSSDTMCTAPSDDYQFLSRGRIIDKAHVLAYATFVQEVDDEVLINTDGTLNSGYCKGLSQQMENVINNTMTVNNEISSVTCFIDPEQNILATSRLEVSLSIIPVGYSSNITISLGFINPANN
ncbi:hypothetical protein GCM10023093_16990 [Nemorincola caseinilytica]|uniref:DUF2586 family protein n=1 Tax=Nemorincola caseinilytica TaxID=2054315 RepID=A0ABP8NEX6_9BACT